MQWSGQSFSDPWCRAFVRSSQWVALTLHSSDQLKIGVSEESITDFLLLRLGRSLKNRIRITKFSHRRERKTGADWEWWFVDSSKGFGFRVQAKRLKARGGSSQPAYEEIRKEQANTLIREAELTKPARYPIYCFYNPPVFVGGFADPRHPLCSELLLRSSCSQATDWAADLAEMFGPCGCTVADAHFVQAAVAANKKDLHTILLGSFPLWCLVCCRRNSVNQPTNGIADVAAAAALIMRDKARAAGSIDLDYEGNQASAVPEAILHASLPAYVTGLMDGKPVEEPIGGLQGVVVFSGRG